MAKKDVAAETVEETVVNVAAETVQETTGTAAVETAANATKAYTPKPKVMLQRTAMINKTTGEQEKSRDGQLMYDYIVNYTSMGRLFKVKLNPPKVTDKFDKNEKYKKRALRQSYDVLDVIYYNTDKAELRRDEKDGRISYFVQNPDPELEGEMVEYPMEPENFKTDGEVLERYFKLVKAGKVV